MLVAESYVETCVIEILISRPSILVEWCSRVVQVSMGNDHPRAFMEGNGTTYHSLDTEVT